jgi:Domain of unknown function (DUF1772)
MSVDGTFLVLATFAAGLTAGGQNFVLVAIVPLKRGWPDSLALPIHQQILAVTADKLLRPMLTVAFAAGVVAIAAHHDVDGVSGAATIVGLAGCVGVMVTSFRFNFPLNKRIAELSLGNDPPYQTLGRRWDPAHAVRTAFGTIAFVGFLIATATL